MCEGRGCGQSRLKSQSQMRAERKGAEPPVLAANAQGPSASLTSRRGLGSTPVPRLARWTNVLWPEAAGSRRATLPAPACSVTVQKGLRFPDAR
ncbi:unnamed protein product [Rangifer tarandus platyrhynchus]|uniref:Uncharacterized protein n=2 Tax=Rangifer tarandus platyrhynchus TaxID=3082113 RepID=A0ACB0FEG2_RANTA|nr:unnamed protein product [Rangifer tarandus platyrhynchus]CAI9711460.1 unnamed protein product [Rangifer tarandus platyrhynchus]